MMLIKRSCLFLFFLSLFTTSELKATHIVGGELNYTYLGGNNYQIRLIVYRDCTFGIAFDDTAHVGFFNSANMLVDSLYMDTTSGASRIIGPIPNFINSPCIIPPSNICYEYCIYTDTINLPPIPGGYQVVYQRCCRNFSIVNLTNPLTVGSTDYATIPDTSIVSFDSNPRFTNLPPNYICVNEPLIFDHSATDADGDSLVYELCTPLDGATPMTPEPHPPNSPPYTPVTFQLPYNLGNVLGGVPMTINSATGLLTATPNATGQFVYGVCVNEYRNGVLIGRTSRDFQVNVVPCQNITVASLFAPAFVCGTNQATFINTSSGASSYNWNFGDTTTLGDTSIQFSPSYTYPDSGTYHVMLIAHSPVNPICADTTYGNVHVFPSFYSALNMTNQHCSSVFNFYDASFGVSAPADYWHWDFGDGIFSANQNPVHSYSAAGTYNVTFISSADSGCTDTVSMIVHVLDVPVSSFSSIIDTCLLQITLADSSSFTSMHQWSFGDGYYSGLATVSHTYLSDGTYHIDLVAMSDSGCSDTSNLTILLPPLPVASYFYQHPLCDSVVSYFSNSHDAIQYSWDFGDGNSAITPNVIHTYSNPGTYVSTLVVNSAYCSDTISHPVTIDTIPEAAFKHPFVCGLANDFIDSSRSAIYYDWNFGDGNLSTIQNPTHNYLNPGVYNVTLVVTTEVGCTDSTAQTITVYPTTIAAFAPQVTPCNSYVTFMNSSTNGQLFNWNFGDSTSAISPVINPPHIYHHAGNYTVTLISNPGVCADSTSRNLMISVPPEASFIHPDECGLTAHFTNQSTDNIFNNWNFGDGITSNSLSPSHAYSVGGTYPVTLVVVNNDLCSDTAASSLRVQLPSIAQFYNYIDTCEQNVKLINQSQLASSYLWDFGDGTSSTEVNVIHQYSSSGLYNVMLIAEPNSACPDTMVKPVSAFRPETSGLYIPNAFTPNGDGKNDGFSITGYNRCLFYHLTIFNRWGEKIFESDDISKPWDGYSNESPVQEGVYVYLLSGGGKELLGHVTVLK